VLGPAAAAAPPELVSSSSVAAGRGLLKVFVLVDPEPRFIENQLTAWSANQLWELLRYQAHRGWLAGDTRVASACPGRRGGAHRGAQGLYGR